MPLQRFLRSTTMLSTVVGASFLSVIAVQAADAPVKAPLPPQPLPAVDGINWKGEAFGGVFDDDGFGGIKGAVTIPLSTQYGFQLDGILGGVRGDLFGQVAGHWFWRDPNVGLLGLYASYTHLDDIGGVHAAHAGVEFERYHGPWTLQGVLGVEGGNSKSALIGPLIHSYDVKTRFFDQINLHYYYTDNARLTIGHRYLGGKHALALGGEWAIPLAPRTLGAFSLEGRIGEDNYTGVWAGLKVYFGQQDKPLIARHRQDDPNIWLNIPTILNSKKIETAPGGEPPCLPGEIFDPEFGCIFPPD
ncbi:MAG: hypothetical protein IT539_01960 [Bradyrhizobiaceae bacterium]|nr:hypothetical protein [Bradyrhizobiaceae bacterium]